jgi:hypothetical protein
MAHLLLSYQVDSLAGWHTQHKQQLAMLMRFLVRLSKQEKLAHVWLATSAWDLGWLTSGKLGGHWDLTFSNAWALLLHERQAGMANSL